MAVSHNMLGCGLWWFRNWLMSLPVTPALGTWLPEERQGKTARAINLNLPPWCVNTSESSSELHLYSPNTSAPGGWLYPHIFQGQGTLHPSGVAQPTPWCAFLVGGPVGTVGHWLNRGGWGWPFCSPGEKLPGLCLELEKILQEFI